MSMYICAQFKLDNESIVSHEHENYQMLEYINELDAFCEMLGVTPISSLIDASRVVTDYEEELRDSGEDDLMDLMTASNDMEPLWFPPRDVIYVLDTLANEISTVPQQLEAPEHHIQELIQELESCVSCAQDALDQGSEEFQLILIS